MKSAHCLILAERLIKQNEKCEITGELARNCVRILDLNKY